VLGGVVGLAGNGEFFARPLQDGTQASSLTCTAGILPARRTARLEA